MWIVIVKLVSFKKPIVEEMKERNFLNGYNTERLRPFMMAKHCRNDSPCFIRKIWDNDRIRYDTDRKRTVYMVYTVVNAPFLQHLRPVF